VRKTQEANTAAARLTILRAFTEMEREQVDLDVFFEAAGNDPAARERVLNAVGELQCAGIIESCGGDLYALL
jgi:hypothetical protein